jgi:hypothetical protein
VRRNRFSRYPYFDEEGETVLGVIHLKDLFFAQQSGKDITDLTHFLRPVETISARTPAQDMFRRFRTGAPHFALIGEKGKRPVGFITLDNLLGAMVGEIRDEFRMNENDWLPQADGTYIGKASLPIFSLERLLGIDIDNEEMGLDDVESVGGLLMAKLGDIPKQGQRIEFPKFDVVVKKMNGPRILLVKVIPPTASSVGPMNIPTTRTRSRRPARPISVSRNGKLVPRLISIGRTTLSTPLIRKKPHTSMKMPQPVLPWANSQIDAPPQITGGPTGISEDTNTSTDSSSTAGTPAMAKPIAATRACASAVPSRPYMTPRTVWLTVSVTDSRFLVHDAHHGGADHRFRARRRGRRRS